HWQFARRTSEARKPVLAVEAIFPRQSDASLARLAALAALALLADRAAPTFRPRCSRQYAQFVHAALGQRQRNAETFDPGVLRAWNGRFLAHTQSPMLPTATSSQWPHHRHAARLRCLRAS